MKKRNLENELFEEEDLNIVYRLIDGELVPVEIADDEEGCEADASDP